MTDPNNEETLYFTNTIDPPDELQPLGRYCMDLYSTTVIWTTAGVLFPRLLIEDILMMFVGSLVITGTNAEVPSIETYNT